MYIIKQTNNGILLVSGTIMGERILPRRIPKKLPREGRQQNFYSKFFLKILLPIAIALASERCFSENHTKENFVGINKINVCANAHINCPKINHAFDSEKQNLFHILPNISIANRPCVPIDANTLKHRIKLPTAFIQTPIYIYRNRDIVKQTIT